MTDSFRIESKENFNKTFSSASVFVYESFALGLLQFKCYLFLFCASHIVIISVLESLWKKWNPRDFCCGLLGQVFFSMFVPSGTTLISVLSNCSKSPHRHFVLLYIHRPKVNFLLRLYELTPGAPRLEEYWHNSAATFCSPWCNVPLCEWQIVSKPKRKGRVRKENKSNRGDNEDD